MISPSEEFKRRMLEPIEALFEDASELNSALSAGSGRNRVGIDGGADVGGRSRADGIVRTTPSRKEVRRYDPEAVQDTMSEITALVGLGGVKGSIDRLAAYCYIESKRRKRKLPGTDLTLHCLFSGNPGTGKTTVARLIGRLFRGLGLLRSGHTVEVDKSDLVGGYLGQTPSLVAEKIAEARGGVLYIDEAYSLTEDSQDLYGSEAISTLIKGMDDHRDDLTVIVAGYPEKMQKFIRANPGLRSRFTRTIYFPDYSPGELQEILRRLCAARALKPWAGFLFRSEMMWQRLYEQAETAEGNGRLVRTAFEWALENQATRLSRSPDIGDSQLLELLPSDWDGIESRLKATPYG